MSWGSRPWSGCGVRGVQPKGEEEEEKTRASHPTPNALKIRRRSLRNMQQRKRSLALGWIRVYALGVDQCVVGATNPRDGVPQPNIARLVARHVDLNEDGTRQDISSRDKHVTEMCHASLSFIANLDDGLRAVGIGEAIALPGDEAEDLANDARSRRDIDGLLCQVNALGEEDDFAAGVLAEDGVDGRAVIILVCDVLVDCLGLPCLRGRRTHCLRRPGTRHLL